MPWTVPPLPASPGFGRLEVPRRLRVSSQNRRWGPPGAPCDTRLSAITWSLHQGQEAAAAAAEALNLQDKLTRGPNAAPVPERRGFHRPAGTDDVGQGTRCCSARGAGHTISSDQSVKSSLSPGVPKSRPRSGTTACTDSPLCAAQNLPSPQACLLPPAETGMLACPPHTAGQAAGEGACGVRERLLRSGGKAAPSHSICKFWAFPSLERGLVPELRMLRSCSEGPCQKHLPSSGSLKFKQTTVQLQGRRKGGEAAPGFLEINWKFRCLLLPPVVQLGKKEMITPFCLASRHFPWRDAEPAPSPAAPEPGVLATPPGRGWGSGPSRDLRGCSSCPRAASHSVPALRGAHAGVAYPCLQPDRQQTSVPFKMQRLGLKGLSVLIPCCRLQNKRVMEVSTSVCLKDQAVPCAPCALV